jgi:hypothetical protein
MTKFVLMIWVCSFLGQNLCMTPIKYTVLYDSWYECSRAAHTQSKIILSKMGYKIVNDGKIGTRYVCTEVPPSI